MPERRSGLATLVATAFLAALPGCGGPARVSAAGTEAAASGRPDDLVVRRGSLETRFLLTGQLEAVRSADLSVPQIPSWETSIRWMEADGAQVKAGQKVVEFDSSAFSGQLDERRLQRDQARSDLEQKEAEIASSLAEREFQVEQRRITLERARAEAAIPESLLAARTWQERQLALRRAEIELDKAVEDLEALRRSSKEDVLQRRIALEKADREIAAARRAVDEMILTAPRDGIFVVAEHPWEGRKLQVGDRVWVGIAVGRLPDLAAMAVKAFLSDVDDGRIVPGLPATCTLDAYPDRTFRGRVRAITPVAREPEQRSLRRSFDVAIDLDETDPARMRPGLSVKVEIAAKRLDDVLVAPRAALDLESEPPRARREGGEVVAVSLGPCGTTACVVASGLEDGTALEEFR